MPIRAVTLDAYGTIFDLESVQPAACEMLLSEQGMDADPCALEREWTRSFFALLECYGGEGAREFRTIRDLTAESLAATFERLGVAGDVPRGVECWFEHVRRAPVYPEAPGAIGALARRYALAVVSDADDDVLMPAWKRAGLPVELVFTSESERAYKIEPGSRVFERAFAALGARPGEVAHVGDSRSDVLGALRAGAKAVWLSRDGREWTDATAKPTLVARDLAEAARLIDSMRDA